MSLTSPLRTVKCFVSLEITMNSTTENETAEEGEVEGQTMDVEPSNNAGIANMMYTSYLTVKVADHAVWNLRRAKIQKIHCSRYTTKSAAIKI